MTKKNNQPEEKLPILKCFGVSSDTFDKEEIDYYLEEFKYDFETVTNYFKGKQRDFIYPKEAAFLIALLYHDTFKGEDSITELFVESKDSTPDPKVEELKRNYAYLIKQLKDDNKLNFSLFLWTVFKTFHFFRDKSKYSTYKQNSFIILKQMLELTRILNNGPTSYAIEDIACNSDDTCYIDATCRYLLDDLINAIMGEFPSRTYKPMIFLGYNLHYPGGCCQLIIEMQSFYKFIGGITNYDYWICGDGEYGKEFFFKKIHVKRDYQKLIGEVFNEN